MIYFGLGLGNLLRKFLNLWIRLVHLDGLVASLLVKSPSEIDLILTRAVGALGEYWKLGGIRYFLPGTKLPSSGNVGIKRWSFWESLYALVTSSSSSSSSFDSSESVSHPSSCGIGLGVAGGGGCSGGGGGGGGGGWKSWRCVYFHRVRPRLTLVTVLAPSSITLYQPGCFLCTVLKVFATTALLV